MCCIFGFLKWSLSCIQRSLTFVLGFWVVATILYALAFGLSAGVAFGYDYGLAEYKTLARPDVQFTMRPRMYVPEVLSRRRGNVAGIRAVGDEYQPKLGTDEALEQETYEYTPPTLWLYEPSRQYSPRPPASPSTPATRIVKMYYRVTKARKKVTPEEDETYIMSEMFKPRRVEPNMLSKTSNIIDNLRVKPLISIFSTSKLESRSTKPISTSTKQISTSAKPITTSPKLDSTPTKLDSTSSKSYSTTLKPDSTFAKAEITVRQSTTSLWPSKGMRIFMPNKSTFFKWRPTKPTKQFFYKTLAASHKRKTTEDSYHPEMEIRTFRTIVDGKYERLPMRHWDAPTRTTQPTERDDVDNAYKNIMYF